MKALLHTGGTLLALAVAGAFAQAGAQTSSVTGRLFDGESRRPVADATVLLEGTQLGAVSDVRGLFRIENVPVGTFTLRVVHLAYGEFREEVEVTADTPLTVRITLTQTAIELEPVTVEVLTSEEYEVRSRGTRRNVVTREDITRMATPGGHIGHVLARRIPGIRIRTDQNRVGDPICIEFRSPVSIVDALRCKHPVVFLDGTRVANPAYLYASLPMEDIERMEVIPPGEAGVMYGTDSSYGVLLIETRTAASVLGEAGEEPLVMRRVAYDWTLEPEPQNWKKVFLFSLGGTAVGLALGIAAAEPCLRFDGLSNHFFESECGGLATAASRIAVLTFPQLGAAVASHLAGSTEVSRGRFWYAAIATSLVAVPGFILATTSNDDGFQGSTGVGKAMIAVGVPAMATLADRLFRSLRPESLLSGGRESTSAVSPLPEHVRQEIPEGGER